MQPVHPLRLTALSVVLTLRVSPECLLGVMGGHGLVPALSSLWVLGLASTVR